MDAAKIVRTVSLRRTALVYMTILLTVLGLASIAVAYLYAYNAATEFLDGQLRQIALNAGPGVPAADAPASADQDPEDQFAVTIWNADGRLVHASLPSVHIARQDPAGFSNVNAGGETWRVYTTSDGRWTVQVAQREVVREEIAQSAALGAAAPVLFAIPLAWLVVSWAMNRVLGRLKALADQLAERSAAATAPIELSGVPTEVAPLVSEHEQPHRPTSGGRRGAQSSFLPTPLTSCGRRSPQCKSKSTTLLGRAGLGTPRRLRRWPEGCGARAPSSTSS